MIKAVKTPLLRDQTASEQNIFLKCENLQPGGSYKIRGVQRFLDSIKPDIEVVQTLSAGNMARTLAMLANDRKIRIEAFVPDSIPKIKQQTLLDLGVSLSHLPMVDLWKLVEDPPSPKPWKSLLHPIDSQEMLDGYATLADEILDECPDLTDIVLPFGVGGLSIGVATGIKRRAAHIRIIAAERSDVSPFSEALRNNHSTYVEYKKCWIDAIGTPRILPRVLAAIKTNWLIDEVRTVDPETALLVARELYKNQGLLIEGAAAVALAASRMQIVSSQVLSSLRPSNFQKTVCILSGGNTTVETLLN